MLFFLLRRLAEQVALQIALRHLIRTVLLVQPDDPPQLTFPPRPNAIDTQVMGKPCTKFVVPSTGSTIQVGASVRAATDPASALDSYASTCRKKKIHKISLSWNE